MTYKDALSQYKSILSALGDLSKTNPGRGKVNLRSSAGYMIDELARLSNILHEIVVDM